MVRGDPAPFLDQWTGAYRAALPAAAANAIAFVANPGPAVTAGCARNAGSASGTDCTIRGARAVRGGAPCSLRHVRISYRSFLWRPVCVLVLLILVICLCAQLLAAPGFAQGQPFYSHDNHTEYQTCSTRRRTSSRSSTT